MLKLNFASATLTLLLCLCISTTAVAQSYYFKEYNVSDGMPFVQVETIVQDRNGYLWTGGYGGLSQFDGKTFKNYSKLDGLVSTTINQLCIDEKGTLWIATPKGLNWLSNDSIKLFSQISSSVHQLSSFPEGIFVVQDSSVSIITDKELIHSIPLNHPFTIGSFAFWNDTLWYGSQKGLSYSTSPYSEFKSVDNWEGGMVYNVSSNFNSLLIGCESGLDIWSDSSKTSISWKDGLLGGRVLKAYQKNDREWWAVTDLGVNVISVENKLLTFDLVNIGSNTQIRKINTFLTDSELNTWIGTSHGLFKSTGNAFKNYTYNDGLRAGFVFDITQDSENSYWIGTRDQGVFKYNGKSFIEINQAHGLLSDEAKAIECFGDSVLIGTSKGLNLYYKGKLKSFPSSRLPINSVNVITQLRDGRVIMGGYNGITEFPDFEEHFIELPTKLGAEVWLLYEDSEGTIWIGTYQGGLFQLIDDQLINVFHEWDQPFETCLAMTEDKKGNLWVGTFEGIIRYNLKDRSIQHLTTEHGLNSNLIYTMQYDSTTDVIWIGTNQGINKLTYLDESSKDFEIISFGKDEGFTGVECNSHGCYIDENGLLWFGTVNGLITFNQQLYRPNSNENFLEIPNIKLFYKDTSITNHTVLPFDQNNLTFTFKGICLTSPQQVMYRYRLKGVSNEWSPVSSFNQATFSNLDPGNYTFEVISRNNSGIWNSTPESFSFKITPPIWDTLFFKLSVVVVIVLLIITLVRYRLRRIQLRNSLERKLDQMKLQALRAQLNPHFIFNSLNSIQHFINSNEPREANRYLSKFAKLMRLMLDNSRRDAIPLEEDIAALQLYLELEELRFEDVFDHTIEIGPGLEHQSIDVPPMLTQPFIENAILHAFTGLKRKGHIQISYELEGPHINCIVEDDGIGRDASAKIKEKSKKRFHRSSGIHIIQDRLDTLNAYHKERLEVNVEDLFERDQPKGTRVTLRIPILELTKPQ